MISFDPDFAKKFGLHEAIVFERLRILMLKNMQNFQNFHDQKFWVDLNHHVYVNFLHYLPQPDIEYALENLKKREVLESRVFGTTYLYSINVKYLSSEIMVY